MKPAEFRRFAAMATFAEAERAFVDERISSEQWTAYRNAWALTARFSDFGLALKANLHALLRSAERAS